MRRIGSGAVLLSAGVVVGVVVGGGFPAGGGQAAVAASPEQPSAVATSPEPSATETPEIEDGRGVQSGRGTQLADGYEARAAEAARAAAARATSIDSAGGVLTYRGQGLPDLTVMPPSRTDGPLKLTVGLGDSITFRAGSWFRRVCGAGVLHTCRDAGIRGDTTTGMLARLDTDVLALEPQVVTIMAGTNDMRDGTPRVQTMRNIDELVTRISASGATVVLCTIAPRHGTERQALAMNAAIRKYAKTHRIALLDTYKVLGTPEGRFKKGLTRDGIHPNAAGMKAMADYAEARLPRLIGS